MADVNDLLGCLPQRCSGRSRSPAEAAANWQTKTLAAALIHENPIKIEPPEEHVNRNLLEEQFLAHIRGRLQDELIVSAPEHWNSEVLEAVEEAQMRKSTKRIASLSVTELNIATLLEEHAELAVAELRNVINAAIHSRRHDDTMGVVMNRLGRSGLVSNETAAAIFTDTGLPLRTVVDELLIGVLDCEATVRNDATATWNERRIVRACAANAFLSALAAARERG